MTHFLFRRPMSWAFVVLVGAAGCAERASPTPIPPDALPPASAAAAVPGASPTRTPDRPAGTSVDDADAVSAAALRAMWSIDTTVDRDPRAAALRAGPWLSSAYQAALRSDPSPGTDATWTAWTAHRARTRVTLTPGQDQRPADTTTTALRQWSLTITPVGRDGWRGPRTRLIAFVTLARSHRGAPWRVTATTVS